MEVKYYRGFFFPLCELYTDVTHSVSVVRYPADAALQNKKKHTKGTSFKRNPESERSNNKKSSRKLLNVSPLYFILQPEE